MSNKIFGLFLLVILSGCVPVDAPELPALDTPSFSYNDALQKQKDLEKQAAAYEIGERN